MIQFPGGYASRRMMAELADFPITARWPARHPDRIQLYSFPTPNGIKVSIALEELGPLVDRIEQVGDVRAAGALVGVEFVRDEASIAPAPNFHRRVHEAAVRRGVLGITQGGKWVYRLQPAINMAPELFRWSCRQVAEAIEEVAADPPTEPAKLIERDAPDVIEI